MTAQVKGEPPPRRSSDTAWESDPGAVRPTCTVQPSPALCGCHAGCPVSFSNTVPPTRVPLPHFAPLERGQWHPRKAYDHQPSANPGQRRDARMMEHISSVTSGPVRPSPPRCCHPGYCRAVANVVGTQADGTSPHLLLCKFRSHVNQTLELVYGWRSDENSSATANETTPGQSQESPRRPPGTRFARTATQSQSTMRHAAALHLKSSGATVNCIPLVYKRRRRPQAAERLTHISLFAQTQLRYWHLPQSTRKDLEASPPLPPCL
jgi:hypothetical protein